MPISVNGKLISDEVMEHARAQLAESRSGVPGAPDANGDTVRKMVVDRALIQAYAVETIRTLPAGALRRKMKQVIEEFGGETKYRQALKNMNIDPAAFEADVETGIKVDLALDALCSEIPPPGEDELQRHFDEYRDRFDIPERIAAQIVVKHIPNVLEAASAQEFMRRILGELRSGANFSEMVWRHSDYKENDGVIGPLPRGVMPPVFDDAVFTLEEGALSGLIQLPRAVYIARLLKRLPAQAVEFEAVRSRVAESWMLSRENEAIDALSERLRASATIEYL